MIVYYGFQKFENEMLFQYRWKSSSVLTQMNKTLNTRLINEQKRSPLDYHYYQNINKDKSYLFSAKTSPLTRDRLPHYLADLHGLIGYFNVRDKKYFNSPLLPHLSKSNYGKENLPFITNEIESRLEKISQLKKILIENNLLQVDVNQSDLNWNNDLEKALNNQDNAVTQMGNFQLLETSNQQLVFYRDARINQQSSVQGFIVDKNIFLYKLLGLYIKRSGYDNKIQVQLIDSHNGAFSYFYHYSINQKGQASVKTSNKTDNTLIAKELFKGELIGPFQKLSVEFTTGKLPLGSATSFVLLFIVILSFVIIAGTTGFYWLGVKQIALAEQRMNFVSSVSHELKTPLTSILMYSEMLKSGMVTDKKNQSDYHHFIFDESERLSRLINNVLQLSNLSRNQDVVSPEYVNIDVLKSIIQSKVSTLIAKNNFQLNVIMDENISYNTQALIDLDAFSQIVINLIDNAVKFFNAAKINESQRQKIDVIFALDHTCREKLMFSVRDYGPGISNSQLDKIFELFYRCGNEMTRTSPGTGIGLALVHQLVIAQDGTILVTRQQPGVSFDLTFNVRQA
jgi:signal transduction histidine kinase